MFTHKRQTRNIVFSLVSVLAVLTIIGLIAFNGNNPVSASEDPVSSMRTGTMTAGGYPAGNDIVRQTFEIHQADIGEIYNDLHFVVWQKEGWIKINGWLVAITHFAQGSSSRCTSPMVYPPDDYPGQHAVKVDFWGTDIPYCNWLTIDITLWLSDWNTLRIADIYWTRDGLRMTDLPNPGVNVGTPIGVQTQAVNVQTAQATGAVAMATSTKTSSDQLVDAYLHEITFSNDGSKEELLIKGLKVMVSPDNVAYLKDIDFSKAKSFDDFVVPPGKSKVVKVYTDKPYWDDHLYFNYDIYNTANMSEPVFRNNIFDHPVFQLSTPQ